MNIHQVCVSYLHEHDRFLVRINTRGEEEIRLWFTRRLTLGLLPILEKASSEQISRQSSPLNLATPLEEQRQRMLDSFTREAAAYNGDYQTPYREEPVELPLGAEPLLVTEVKMTALPTGELQLDLLEKLADEVRNLQIKMDAQLTHGLVSLLNQGLSNSNWLETEIAIAVKVNTPKSLPGQDAMETLEADKPRYLN
jgi:hypothetical protein